MVTKIVHIGVLRGFGVQRNHSKCRFEVNFWGYKLFFFAHFEAGNKLHPINTSMVENCRCVGLMLTSTNWAKCRNYIPLLGDQFRSREVEYKYQGQDLVNF